MNLSMEQFNDKFVSTTEKGYLLCHLFWICRGNVNCFKALEIESLDDRMPVSKWPLCRVEIESITVVKTKLSPLMD